MKKRSVIITAVLFGVILASVLVAAQNSPADTVRDILSKIGDAIKSFFATVLGIETQSGGYYTGDTSIIYAKFLFFIVIFGILWLVSTKIPLLNERKLIGFIVVIAVSLLSMNLVRKDEFIKALFMPYNTLGAAIAAFVPLIFWFYFVEFGIPSRTLRKIAWIVAIAFFTGLFWWTVNTDATTGATKINPLASYVYLGAAVVSLIVLLMDGTIMGAIRREQARSRLSMSDIKLLNSHEDDLISLMRRQESLDPASKEYQGNEKSINKIRKEIERLEAKSAKEGRTPGS